MALTDNNFVDGQDGRAVVLQLKLPHTLSEARRGSWGLSLSAPWFQLDVLVSAVITIKINDVRLDVRPERQGRGNRNSCLFLTVLVLGETVSDYSYSTVNAC